MTLLALTCSGGRDLDWVSRSDAVPYSGKTLIVVKFSPPLLRTLPSEVGDYKMKLPGKERQRHDSHNFSVIFLRDRDGIPTPEYINYDK